MVIVVINIEEVLVIFDELVNGIIFYYIYFYLYY